MIVLTNSDKDGCFEAVVLETCPDCHKRTLMTYGVFSNGSKILPSGYRPAPNELVKNHASICECGWNQYS